MLLTHYTFSIGHSAVKRMIFSCIAAASIFISSATAKTNSAPSKPNNIWQEIADSLHTENYQKRFRLAVKEEIDWYLSHPKSLVKTTNNAKPYIYYITDEIKKRHMPLEVALLPMVESNYNPRKTSTAAASGLWQLMPNTARHLGVPINKWYDGRCDVVRSTHAALDYLQYLNDFYKSWPLAFAAYNSGMGNVNKAIRYNKKHRLPIDYQSLQLPAETKHYLPKLIAIATILSQPKTYHVPIDPVKNQPYFAAVKIIEPIDIHQIAKFANTQVAVIRQLNPGFKHTKIFPNNSYKLLLPVYKKETFQVNLATYIQQQPQRKHCYTVQCGDSLSRIALKHHVSLESLKSYNHLDTSIIRIGQPIYIPV